MLDTVSFNTFIIVVVLEFCFMSLWLIVIIDRSFRRAFKHLEEKDKLLQRIEKLEDQIGYCEKHEHLHSVVDTFCEDCYEEYKKEHP